MVQSRFADLKIRRLLVNKPAYILKTHYDQLFIDGAWVTPSVGCEDVINPATEEAVGSAPLGSAEDAERAIAAARRAFDEGGWADEDRNVRADRMQRLYDLVLSRKEEAIGLMQLEMGFTRLNCEMQLGLLFTQLERTIEVARKDPIKPLSLIISDRLGGGGRSLGGGVVTRDPVGVVSAITPYNSGFLLGLIKAFPAMAAGNTVVLKPSPFTPLQTMLIAEIVAEIDLPPGVFNVVTGGTDVGQMMSADPRIDMVSFTGSDAVGAAVMAQASPTLKKVQLELGGKSPIVIRHDADMELAVTVALFGSMFQAGQGCSLTTRILVDNRIRPAFVEALGAAAKQIKVGDPYDPATFMGPLIREAAITRSESFCKRALEDGARLVVGGERPAALDKGFFFEVTIFDDVLNSSHLGQREVFGPIAAVIGFDDDAEAIRFANDSDYGLGGGIISRDKATAFEMALKMRTGQIQINGGPGGFHADMPFGGYKRSGLGREWGEEGYNEFTEMKAIGFPAG
jgi:aldehyde dehydrogenase (NAD+)